MGTHSVNEKYGSRQMLAWLGAAALVAWVASTLLFGAPKATIHVVWLGMVGLFVLAVKLVRPRTISRETIPFLLLMGGFFMQLLFVLHMPYDFSWHDLGGFGSLEGNTIYGGHLGHINFWLRWPELPMPNPMLPAYEDYYHPPLYHLLQAGFLRTNLLLGISLEAGLENLQIFTLLASSLCLWQVYCILCQLKMSLGGASVGLGFMAAQPVLWIYGGTLNNDIFCLFWMLLAVFYTLRWLEAPKLRNILGIAIALGLGMATKLSAAALALPIGLVFAVRFFQNLPAWKKYIQQFSLFLLVCAPLGLAWPIFHAIAFQVPFNYIRLPAETINVAHLPLSQRFGIPNGEVLRSLFFSGNRRVDHNVWFQTLKTALFDELTLFPLGSTWWYMSYGLAALFTVLIAASAVLFLRLLFKRGNGYSPLCKVFLGTYGATLLGSYVVFCLQYPYLSTFNFRYIMPLLLLCAIAIADFCRKPSLAAKLLASFTAVFAGAGCAVYMAYFLLR